MSNLLRTITLKSSDHGLEKTVKIRFLFIDKVGKIEYDGIWEAHRHWGFDPAGDQGELVHKRHILGRWLAFTLMKSYGVTEEQFKSLALSPLGKPYLPNHSLSFSISHSENLIGCAVSDMKVGIDLEPERSIDLNEYTDCFSSSEWNRLSQSPTPQRYFLELWTKKESLVKADGRGLMIPLSEVTVLGESSSIPGEGKTWHFYPIEIAGYACHVCTEFPVESITISEEGR